MPRRILIAAVSALLLAPSARASDPSVPARPAAPRRVVYRIDTAGQGSLWSSDRPVQSGDLVLFHVFPSGTLMSVRRRDMVRVVAENGDEKLRPTAYVDIGITGAAATRSGAAPAAGKPPSREPPGPGARKDGTAVLNPDRRYQPDIDNKQVPGLNMAYPPSPNDYREGKTLAYPAAQAVQAAPGDPPRMPDPKPN